MESIFPYCVIAGVILFLLGVILLLIAAFRTRIWWALGIIAFPPVALGFFAKHSSRSLVPSLLMFFGIAMVAGPSIYTKVRPVDLGPVARVVDGELVLTLTGWDRKDYSVLRSRPSAVILQMANPDVTDQTLIELEGMKGLRELDLNHTKITDAGLKLIREQFPRLESLKISGTLVTDPGINDHLASMDSLKRLDVRNTAVTRDAVKAWKGAKPGRQALP